MGKEFEDVRVATWKNSSQLWCVIFLCNSLKFRYYTIGLQIGSVKITPQT